MMSNKLNTLLIVCFVWLTFTEAAGFILPSFSYLSNLSPHDGGSDHRHHHVNHHTRYSQLNSSSSPSSSDLSHDDCNDASTESIVSNVSYSSAREIRLENGHMAAVPLYQELLKQNHDVTAATRIAAAKSSPWRHDQTCPVPTKSSATGKDHRENIKITEAIKNFRIILEKSHFDNKHVQQMFGIPPMKENIDYYLSSSHNDLSKEQMLAFAKCPIYISARSAGTQSTLPPMMNDLLHKDSEMDENDNDGNDYFLSSLKCIVSLFSLGLAVPKNILVDNLIGGEEAVSLMEYLGLLFPCEMDTSIMVPYAHLFPIDVDVIEQLSDNESQNDDELDSKQSSIILVTDLHPKVLSRTTVGEGEDGAVMYIGPDSLALLQCLPLESHLDSLKGMSENDETFRVLDLCTGSGIQAISTLCALKLFKPDASAILVDVNDRALRFSRFNALLNNIGDDRISTVKTNLVNSQHDFLVHKTFDIILSNPPFIPTPDTSQVIEKRYGLFSSGGVDGEAVLLSVISMSKRLLKARGLVSIVSEFMNPPHKESDRELLDKIQNWWNLSVYENDDGQQSMRGIGILFTNEYPISASTYATRRADNESEFEMWSKHLEKCNIQNVSPGFLFLRTTQGSNLELSLQTKQVPKTKFGSIWTPSNIHAVRYVENEWNSKID